MDGDGWGGRAWNTGKWEMKREKAQLVLAKIHSSRTHTYTHAHTPSRTLLVREWDPIYEHTHVCVYAYKYMRDPSDMLKICIEN